MTSRTGHTLPRAPAKVERNDFREGFVGGQLDMTRRLLGEVEFHRQRAAGVRAAAREVAVLAQIQIVADEAGVPLSSVSQGLAGSNGRDVGLVLLSALAEHDHDRKLGDALAALWGCELRPLPDRAPAQVQALKELEDLRTKVSAAIERLK